MAMLWELVCYVNCACVTLMGRVEALEEMRRDRAVSKCDRQTGQRHQQLLFDILPTPIDNSRAGRYTGSYRIPVFIFLTI